MKQKHRKNGAIRTVTKEVPADSFFNFFGLQYFKDTPIFKDKDEMVSTCIKKLSRETYK